MDKFYLYKHVGSGRYALSTLNPAQFSYYYTLEQPTICILLVGVWKPKQTKK